MNRHHEITCISCGIFRPKLCQLEHLGKITFPIIYLDSMLHMKPRKLREALTRVVEKELALGKSVVLLYGSCQPHMFELEKRDGVFRVEGRNCIEILVGKKRYRKILKDRSFILMREWAQRWEEVFTHGLGFNSETARMFMPEHHSELVYVDSDAGEIPCKAMDECADFCSLPWRHEKISLAPLTECLQSVLTRIRDKYD